MTGTELYPVDGLRLERARIVIDRRVDDRNRTCCTIALRLMIPELLNEQGCLRGFVV